MKVKIKKLLKSAVIPSYSKEGDAGLDLTVTAIDWCNYERMQIGYSFGISIEIPFGYVGLLFPRSSIFKAGCSLSNSVGVIDSGYRGEVKAVFNLTGNDSYYREGDRAVQLIIMPYPQIEFEEVEELSETERGSGGYGHTGS